MKDYEIYSDLKIPKNMKLVLRLDGRRFHNLSRRLNLEKPYDYHFSQAMIEVSKSIFKDFSPLFIYTFSDELNILLSEVPFSGRIEKLDSVFPSLASSLLILNLIKNDNYFNILNQNNSIDNCQANQNLQSISFDSRVIPLSNEDVFKYFKWRQDEAWRNCVNSYGYWELRKCFDERKSNEKLKCLKLPDIHELLFKKGINLNNVPTWHKRGIAIYKKSKEIKGLNPKIKKEETYCRKYLFIDKEVQIFNNDFFQWLL